MAVFEIILPMLTVTAGALTILGIIKRRCGASQEISELATRCTNLVSKIQEILEKLGGYNDIPPDLHLISTSLRHRRAEYYDVSKSLKEMLRLTRRTGPWGRTKKFIMPQGWAKKMENIQTDLVHVRNGIENIASNWDLTIYVVTKVGKKLILAQYLQNLELSTNEKQQTKGVDVQSGDNFSSATSEITEPMPFKNPSNYSSLQSSSDGYSSEHFENNPSSRIRIFIYAIIATDSVPTPLATKEPREPEKEAPMTIICWCFRKGY